MALSEQTIDVPLNALDQHVPKTGGLVGSLSNLLDAEVVKFQGAPGAPPNLVRVDKREAFATLSDVVRSTDTGTVQAGASLGNQTLLAEFDRRLLLVAGDRTHVYSKATAAFERHNYQLAAYALTQDFVHTSNSLATTPDTAQAGGVFCDTWVTTAAHDAGGGTPTELAGCYFRVVDSDGVVLRGDTLINLTDTRVKVVSDGSVFWVVSEKGDGTGNFNVLIVDQHGATLGSTTFACTYTSGDFWDITDASFGVVVAQPTGTGVQFSKMTQAAGVVTRTAATDATIAGFHKLALHTNDSDANVYLSTVEHVGANNNTVHVYRVPATLAQNHHYGAITAIADEPANVTGYVVPGTSDLVIAFSVIDPTAAPNTEYLKNQVLIYSVTFAGASTHMQSVLSMNLASRAFALGTAGTYYAVGYYPSGLAVVSGTEALPNQPTYFLIPLGNALSQKTAGRFEYAAAYCDWQVSGSPYNFALASCVTAGVASTAGKRTALSYRAESFTSSFVQVHGDVGQVVQTQATTVGVKAYSFGDPGESVALADEILLPGPGATSWSGGEFSEHGINLAFEQPNVVQTAIAGPHTALTPGTYQWIVVAEWTDTNGSRVRSRPSPAVTKTIAANQYAVLTGYMLHATNKKDLLISIYRTDMVPDSGGGFVATTTHYKITVDAATSAASPLFNDSGAVTWTFSDSNMGITANEILYTDKGQLENYPAPPFFRGTVWRNRVFLVSYDNSVWFSAEPTEGDALWFHPAFRIVLPTKDRIVAIAAATEDYLLVLCESSLWYVPAATLPDSSGGGGTIPNAIELKFNMGCTGKALVTKLGCVYASSAGGLWLITRSLENTWLGEPMADTLSGTVTALAVAGRQRIYALAAGVLAVYDMTSQCWYEWNPPSTAQLLTSFQGLIAFGDGALVWQQAPGLYVDTKTQAGVTTLLPYHHGLNLNSLHFGGVRNFASLLEMQLVGDTHTASTVNLALSFDDDPTVVESTSWVTDPAVPFAYSYGPANQLCSAVGISITESLGAGQTAGQGFSLEMLVLTVGLYQGQNRLPDNRRV